ncbi:MAG: ABC transporter permease [Phycisphaerales bacterium]|nr:ABC transporter permease [Phycisphaerales bacterium]MCB9854552.1 ABC transporter permease [Phycisphaerales bacterium]MCB9863207.1 ABC transporter permease [Phycisphaerales bacterium]
MLTIKNLGRNKLRTTLTIMAIALPLFVFLVTSSLKQSLNDAFASMEKSMRVATHQKLTYTTLLPQRMRGEIESIAPEGFLEGVCRSTWFGGKIEGSQQAYFSMAVDCDTFPVVHSEFEMTPDEIARFNDTKQGAVVGQEFAKLVNVGIGDKVTMKGAIPPFVSLEFEVVAIPKGLEDARLYFRLDYYDDVYRKITGDSMGVHNFWMRCSSPEARKWALTEIDRHFRNSQNETVTETESNFIRSFIESGGDWIGMASKVGLMVVIVALSVGFNTMSMSFRERTSEIAVLRALGFSASRIGFMVVSEGLLLGLAGGIIAVAPLYLLTHLREVSIPQFGKFTIETSVAGTALFVAVLCGFLAALVPAAMAVRLQVATALRKVA